MILSLAMANPALGAGVGADACGLAFVLVDPKGHAFAPFEGLPHLARPVIRDVDEVAEALQSLVRLMERRGGETVAASGRPTAPCIVVVIDELADLLMAGGSDVQLPLTRLTQRGREAGIHIVAATQKPTAAVLGPLVKANFPVRLVGRMTSVEDARTASGWSGTGAERLLGQGDFLAVAEGRVIRFQVAHVTSEEIHRTVAQLSGGGRWSEVVSPPVRSRSAALPWPVRRAAGIVRGGA